MSDLERLRDTGSDVERELVDAWRTGRAPATLRARALALAGAGGATVLAAASASATSAVGSTSASVTSTSVAATSIPVASAGAATAPVGTTLAGAAAAGTPKVVTAAGIVAMKWVAGVGIAAAIGAGTVASARHVDPSTPGAMPVRASSRPAFVAAASPSAERSGPSAGDAAETPRERAESNRGAVPVTASPTVQLPHRTAAPFRPSRDGRLAAQLAVVDEAREALAAGDVVAALRDLDAFDSKYPSSPIAVEAAALRFDALVASGDHAAAQAAGRAFVARWPSSPYTARVRRALDAHR
jgi:hypothetical protein